jgi:hypothetical protein
MTTTMTATMTATSTTTTTTTSSSHGEQQHKHKIDLKEHDDDEFSPATKRRKTTIRASWDEVVDEASTRAHNDVFMEEIIQKYILDHKSFGSAIAYTLSHEFGGVISVSKWDALFQSVFADDLFYMDQSTAESMGLEDLRAIRERDPASDGLVNPFLNFKGFKALQSHRVAHLLWHLDRKDTARAIQSRCSELFGVDIHPAAVIGKCLSRSFSFTLSFFLSFFLFLSLSCSLCLIPCYGASMQERD